MPRLASRPSVRLIALDLDGTTLTSTRQIHPRNADAIARAIDAGITIVLASGRIRPSMLPFAHQLGLGDGPLICSNGAHVVAPDGATIVEDHLLPQTRNSIIDFAEREGLHLNGYTTDRMFYVQPSPWLDLYRSRARTIPSEQTDLPALRAMNLIKLMVIAAPTAIRSLARRGHELFDLKTVTLTESEPEYLEFLPQTANKGAGLRELATHIGVSREEVMAVGDYCNDVEMVEWAGRGVAMGNAVAEVKAIAQSVTGINDDGGVADAIETVLQ